jgi:hypothetical protein
MSVCELPVPFGALGLEAWVDNYVLTDLGDGAIDVGTGLLTTAQRFDVDYIEAYQRGAHGRHGHP